ncbi:hypothetical protein NEFER03_1789 [Nematocida sp. LUAm3]|nr:hypothetical protein NEFER03_1789 [Nematocida sp. LUAm3]KAI5173904.1 hypothetical protein NEFER02_0371 [Nematocida sp. LUAm2]KAI5177351.1 hypothetical protein NEFER01_0626 [Nematocida sp. LUAm1]
MLDRRYIVPCISVTENGPKEGVEECIEKLVSIKESINEDSGKKGMLSSKSLEMELDVLFGSIGGERVVSEMERVVVLLCKIAHRIIQSECPSEEENGVLLQIFELGLFMSQFKDRWLEKIKKSKYIHEHGWTLLSECHEVSRVFPPANELISLAQEYMLRKNSLSNNRNDLCAFALANALGAYLPSISLLLRQRKETRSALGDFFFIAYILSESKDTHNLLLIEWMSSRAYLVDEELVYISGVDINKFFGVEISKMQDIGLMKKALIISGSHRIINQARRSLLALYRRHKVDIKEIIEILSETYRREEVEYTERIIEAIKKISPVGAESVLKALIIYRGISELSGYFFENAFIMDKEYAECMIICQEEIGRLPCEKLNEFCSSEYFGFVSWDLSLFKRIVKCVLLAYERESKRMDGERIVVYHGWNLGLFIEQALEKFLFGWKCFEKAVILIEHFPHMEVYIREKVYGELHNKKVENSLLEDMEEIDKKILLLSSFREIPLVRKVLWKIIKGNKDKVDSVIGKEIDYGTIQYIQRALIGAKKSLPELLGLMQWYKEKSELHRASYWNILIKKHIVLGKTVNFLSEYMPIEDILLFVNNEEDIETLLFLALKKKEKNELHMNILEKLNMHTKYEQGIVMGSNSYILIPLNLKNISIYGNMIQKEFAGRESLAKVVCKAFSVELFIDNGKLFLSQKVSSKGSEEESIIKIEEEIEKHALGGWKISFSLFVSRRKIHLRIGETEIQEKIDGSQIEKAIIGESFKGIIKRVLLVEESQLKNDRLSLKPSEDYYLDQLQHIEKRLQYYKKFGVLMETTTPYFISGEPRDIQMVNAFTNTPAYWRSSKRISKKLSKISVKNDELRKKLISMVTAKEDGSFHFPSRMEHSL